MKVAVLGAGFGLYGYLPALMSLGHTVVLPQRYRSTVGARAELAGFLDRIEWCSHEDTALDDARAVVLARRPDDQSAMLPSILARRQIGFLVLEKPLARDPVDAARLHAELVKSGRSFRVGYTFPLTAWGRRLRAGAAPIDSITWRFRAHHYATNARNWKRLHSQGGGGLRFYGIQIIGLLAQLGFDRVLSSETTSATPDEVETWTAVFSGIERTSCRVVIDSNADRPEFVVQTTSTGMGVRLDGPFGEQSGPQDRRVPLLAALCAEALEGDRPFCGWHASAITLWQRVEEATVHRIA